jgi:hypothetical protein
MAVSEDGPLTLETTDDWEGGRVSGRQVVEALVLPVHYNVGMGKKASPQSGFYEINE